MAHPFFSFFLVGVQFGTLLYLIFTSPLRFATPFSFLCFAGGLLLGLSALLAMRGNRWNIQPDVASGTLLVTRGPYAFIRHPMYAAVLLVALGLLAENVTATRLLVFGLLLGDLLIKSRYEEYLLARAFPTDYPQYRGRTQALIPYVY